MFDTSTALLPAGFTDLLAPDAARESESVSRLMSLFAQNGYAQVRPPLIEFEDSILSGNGGAPTIAGQTFRLMDPVSQKMLGVRTDMTIQVARMAATRLASAPRPLRLCYAGSVLRVRGNTIHPSRQFTQAGLELIGSDKPAAEAEVILLSAAALTKLGLKDVSIDVMLPGLISDLLAPLSLPPKEMALLRDHLDHKNPEALRLLRVGGYAQAADLLEKLLSVTGALDTALPQLKKLDLPARGKELIAHLQAVYDLVRAENPDVSMTVDPVERRGFEYYTGLCFSFFSPSASGALGRGGRYALGENENSSEVAAGVTFFMDALYQALPEPMTDREKLYVPLSEKQASLASLSEESYVLVRALEDDADPMLEAKRMGCTHILNNGAIEAVS